MSGEALPALVVKIEIGEPELADRLAARSWPTFPGSGSRRLASLPMRPSWSSGIRRRARTSA